MLIVNIFVSVFNLASCAAALHAPVSDAPVGAATSGAAPTLPAPAPSAASLGGVGASEFHERLRRSGLLSSDYAKIYVGAAGLSHGHDDQPPPKLAANSGGPEGCSALCTWNVPELVNRSGDEHTIRWRMIPTLLANPRDWVGLYEADAPHAHYLDFFLAMVDMTGTGQRTLRLYNLRSKLHFRFISEGKCLCKSRAFDFAHGLSEPTQARISLTADPTEMQLTWVSGHPVGYAELRGVDGHLAATASRYVASDMCQAPANTVGPWAYRDVGWIHTVTLPRLSADSLYEYRCGHGNVTTDWTAFMTAPTGGEEWAAVAYGDMGVAGGEDRFYQGVLGAHFVLKDLLNRKMRLAVHPGDLSYARGVGFVWDVWGNEISSIASAVPYMVSIGNHEYDHTSGEESDDTTFSEKAFAPLWGNFGNDSFGECAVPVVKRFPNPPATGFGVVWYSYDFANVHWVMLSSEHDWRVGSRQYQWLAKDLGRVDRQKTPWVVVTAHRPAYNSLNFKGDHRVAEQMAANLDPLFVERQVNLFLGGHYHSYERTCPVAGQQCQGSQTRPRAPVHITVGTAGFGLDSLAEVSLDKNWRRRVLSTFGYLVLRVRPELIGGEFWGAEDPKQPTAPFALLDSFEVHPYHGEEEGEDGEEGEEGEAGLAAEDEEGLAASDAAASESQAASPAPSPLRCQPSTET